MAPRGDSLPEVWIEEGASVYYAAPVYDAAPVSYAPPVGTVVASLPGACSSISISGISYMNVFYTPIYSGGALMPVRSPDASDHENPKRRSRSTAAFSFLPFRRSGALPLVTIPHGLELGVERGKLRRHAHFREQPLA